MRKIHYIWAFALLFCACNSNSLDNAAPGEEMVTVRISTDAAPEILPATRTQLNAGRTVTWHEDDAIMFVGANETTKLVNTSPAGPDAVFEGQVPSYDIGDNSNVTNKNAQFVIYPYSENVGEKSKKVKIDGNWCVTNLVLQAVQEMVPGTFGQGYNLSAAAFQWSSNSVRFKNLCGLLCLKLKGNANIQNVEITAPEYISGTFRAWLDGNDYGQSAVFATGFPDDVQGNPRKSRSVTLAAENPIQLNDAPQTFYACVLPYKSAGEYTVTATTVEGFKVSRTVRMEKGVDAAKILDLGEFTIMGPPFDLNQINADADAREVALKRNVEYLDGNYEVIPSASWITASKTDSGMTVRLDSNATGAERNGTIDVVVEGNVQASIPVSQMPYDYYSLMGQYMIGCYDSYLGTIYWMFTLAEGESGKYYDVTLSKATTESAYASYNPKFRIEYSGIGSSLLSLPLPQTLENYDNQAVSFVGAVNDESLCQEEGTGFMLEYTGKDGIHSFNFLPNSFSSLEYGPMTSLSLIKNGIVWHFIAPVYGDMYLKMTLVGSHQGNHDGFIRKDSGN